MNQYVPGSTDDFPLALEREAGLQDHYPPVAVGFGLAPILDDLATAKAGHEVYRDVVFVKIAIPGDRASLYFQPAQDSHKKRFPQAWKAHLERDSSKPREGLPIELWAAVSKAQALNLKTMHIHTVEALSEVHEGHIESLGFGGRELREKARAFLAQAKSAAAITKEISEKEELKRQLTALQNQINAMQQSNVAPRAGFAPSAVAAAHDTTDDVEADVAKAARRQRKVG